MTQIKKKLYMEISKKYKKIISEYCKYFIDNHFIVKGEVKASTVIDEDAQIYILTALGWENEYLFVYDILFHIEIIDEKVCIQLNDTNISIGDELIERGIGRNDLKITAQHENEYILNSNN